MTISKIKIGILGASRIAPAAIVHPAKNIEDVEVVYIAASNIDRAEEFAQKYDIPNYTGDYDALIGNDHVDVVYISLINDLHYEYALKAVQKQKHVLVEKPLCLTFGEFEEINACAAANKMIAMEALMAEHHPWQDTMLNLIRDRGYGRIHKITSHNNFVLKGANDFRITSKKGGGAIYDLGCYCLQFVQRMVGLQYKSAICVSDSFGSNDVDTEFSSWFVTPDDVQVEIHCSFRKPFKAHHIVECERGRLEVKNFFRAGFGYNMMKIHCTDLETGNSDIVAFEPMNFYHNQLLKLVEMIHSKNCGSRFVEAGQRVRMMEELRRIRKIAMPMGENDADAYCF